MRIKKPLPHCQYSDKEGCLVHIRITMDPPFNKELVTLNADAEVSERYSEFRPHSRPYGYCSYARNWKGPSNGVRKVYNAWPTWFLFPDLRGSKKDKMSGRKLCWEVSSMVVTSLQSPNCGTWLVVYLPQHWATQHLLTPKKYYQAFLVRLNQKMQVYQRLNNKKIFFGWGRNQRLYISCWELLFGDMHFTSKVLFDSQILLRLLYLSTHLHLMFAYW